MKVKNKILTMVALTVLTCATYSSIGYADTSDKNTDTSVVTTTLSEEKRSDELDQSSTGSSSEMNQVHQVNQKQIPQLIHLQQNHRNPHLVKRTSLMVARRQKLAIIRIFLVEQKY